MGWDVGASEDGDWDGDDLSESFGDHGHTDMIRSQVVEEDVDGGDVVVSVFRDELTNEDGDESVALGADVGHR